LEVMQKERERDDAGAAGGAKGIEAAANAGQTGTEADK
jgi:hypothetical protein